MYALNLNPADKRILSATYEQFAAPGQPLVEELPDGNMFDWLYVSGEYVYDPIPEPEVFELASRRYGIGELIENGSELYETISIIPAGSKLIPGSNIRKITLEEYVNRKVEEAAT